MIPTTRTESKMTNLQTSSPSIVTVDDVNAVLSALITGPFWDAEKVEELEKEALSLTPGSGEWVLAGVKGWIEGEEEMGNTTNGQASALDLINRIARRERISIVGSDVDEAGFIQGLINRAYTL